MEVYHEPPIVSEFETQEQADSYDHWRSTLTSITLGGFLVVAHPNYVLVYRVAVDCIEVVSVLHARQQYP